MFSRFQAYEGLEITTTVMLGLIRYSLRVQPSNSYILTKRINQDSLQNRKREPSFQPISSHRSGDWGCLISISVLYIRNHPIFCVFRFNIKSHVFLTKYGTVPKVVAAGPSTYEDYMP